MHDHLVEVHCKVWYMHVIGRHIDVFYCMPLSVEKHFDNTHLLAKEGVHHLKWSLEDTEEAIMSTAITCAVAQGQKLSNTCGVETLEFDEYGGAFIKVVGHTVIVGVMVSS